MIHKIPNRKTSPIKSRGFSILKTLQSVQKSLQLKKRQTIAENKNVNEKYLPPIKNQSPTIVTNDENNDLRSSFQQIGQLQSFL